MGMAEVMQAEYDKLSTESERRYNRALARSRIQMKDADAIESAVEHLPRGSAEAKAAAQLWTLVNSDERVPRIVLEGAAIALLDIYRNALVEHMIDNDEV